MHSVRACAQGTACCAWLAAQADVPVACGLHACIWCRCRLTACCMHATPSAVYHAMYHTPYITRVSLSRYLLLLLQTLTRLQTLQGFEFIGDLSGLLPGTPASRHMHIDHSPSRASLSSFFDADRDRGGRRHSLGFTGMLGNARRSPVTAGAGGGASGSGGSSGSGSGGVRSVACGPSVLSVLLQLGNLSSLVLEHWTGAFTGLGECVTTPAS